MILDWNNTFVCLNVEHFTFYLQCINILVHLNLTWTFPSVNPYLNVPEFSKSWKCANPHFSYSIENETPL